MIRKLYPEGKNKAFNLTYDDGIMQDARFVHMLNRYGVPATFNLNYGLMQQEFEWVHESGMIVKRLSEENCLKLYQGHEVASHTMHHPYMSGLDRNAILYELGEDKYRLGLLFDREIGGFAAPFDYYSPMIASCVRELGFEYGRISESVADFAPQTDYYNWRATAFHLNPALDRILERFYATDEELAVCQIVGHTYDLDVADMWGKLEAIVDKVSHDEDIWCTTHIDLVRYLKAMDQVRFEKDGIVNPSGIRLWFEVDGNIVCV